MKKQLVVIVRVSIFSALAIALFFNVVTVLYDRIHNGVRSNKRPMIASIRTDVDFDERRDRVNRACRKHLGYDAETHGLPIERSATPGGKDVRRKSFYQFTFYDDNHHFMFCTIPKIASTTIKEALLGLAQELGQHSPSNDKPHIHRLIELLTKPEVAKRADYTKIMFTRHPIERVISAWSDKFKYSWPVDHPELVRIGRHIIRTYRSGEAQSADSPPPTLEEFFQFLRDNGTTEPYDDVHWRPYVNLCDPCRVSYQWFGRFERLSDEFAYIMSAATGGRNISLPMRKSSATKRYLSPDGNGLPPRLIEQVAERYTMDFQAFAYKLYGDAFK